MQVEFKSARAWWREAPLNEYEEALLAVLFEAHRRSAFRDNLSSAALRLAGAGSGDYGQALTAALATLGGTHAPIAATVNFLRDNRAVALARSIAASGRRVPGWGNSFVKGRKDELWLEVERCLAECDLVLAGRLEQVTAALHELGKNIYPNPSAYTAAAALSLGIPGPLAPWLFVRGRLEGWSELLLKGPAVLAGGSREGAWA